MSNPRTSSIREGEPVIVIYDSDEDRDGRQIWDERGNFVIDPGWTESPHREYRYMPTVDKWMVNGGELVTWSELLRELREWREDQAVPTNAAAHPRHVRASR
ncbi:MAG: hypothetical protein ACRDRD_18655 [Pseudonocardiaceae bacterium]